MNKPMISFKQFVEMQRDAIDHADAQKIYDEYKKEYQQKHAQIFFESHGSEPWFLEKYDPEEAYLLKKEQNAVAQKMAQQFIERFVKGGEGKKICLDE